MHVPSSPAANSPSSLACTHRTAASFVRYVDIDDVDPPRARPRQRQRPDRRERVDEIAARDFPSRREPGPRVDHRDVTVRARGDDRPGDGLNDVADRAGAGFLDVRGDGRDGRRPADARVPRVHFSVLTAAECRSIQNKFT
eukprot:9401-Pelagococcus_subviridis.AAC.1